jgi:hypothetical protein
MENYQIEAIPEKIVCPHCGSKNCFEEGMMLEISPAMVYSYMCMGCGYTSTTLSKVDSDLIKDYEETTAEIVKEIKWIDPNTNLVWYPTVLNFPSSGIIFPDGTNKSDWGWTAAPAVDIPKEDMKKYPIPGTDQFYTRRIDMQAAKKFKSNEFSEACKSIGFIKEV